MAEKGCPEDLAKAADVIEEALGEKGHRMPVTTKDVETISRLLWNNDPNARVNVVPNPGVFPPNLASALAKAQAKVHAAGKSGENTYDRYNYATLEDFCKAIREPMAENGLAFSVDISEVKPCSDRKTRNGGVEFVVLVTLKGILIHESGETVTFTGYGQGQDRGDKAIYKAITGGKKYLIANIFNVPTTDDPEIDSHEDSFMDQRPASDIPANRNNTGSKGRSQPPNGVGEQFVEGSLNSKYQTANGLLGIQKLAKLKDAVEKAKLDPKLFLLYVNKVHNHGKPSIANSYNIKAAWFDDLMKVVEGHPELISGAAKVSDDVVAGEKVAGISKVDAKALQDAFKAGGIPVPEGAEVWLSDYLSALNPPVQYTTVIDIPAIAYPEILDIVKDHPDTVLEHLEYKKTLEEGK